MSESTIIALFVTSGLDDFLQNALRGLERVGIDRQTVHVARPNDASGVIDRILGSAGAHATSFRSFCDLSPEAMPQKYVEYGTEGFIQVTWAKVRYLRWLLDRHEHVVYADIDVAWLGNPLRYLQSVAHHYPLAFQTEAIAKFPPPYCIGFMSLRSTEVSRRLLDELSSKCEYRISESRALNDQQLLRELVSKDPSWVSQIYPLPESLFLNGLGYKTLLATAPPAALMEGLLAPFTFHANWTIGLNNKRALLMQTGTWLN
jgi:hypothetical protein